MGDIGDWDVDDDLTVGDTLTLKVRVHLGPVSPDWVAVQVFTGSPNELSTLLPDLAHLSDVLRVIDVKKASGGLSLRILMNGDSDEAVGFLAA